MVNHAFMLLVNERRSAVGALSSIYMPSGFVPIVVPEWLAPVRDCFFPAAFSLAERVRTVDDMLVLLHTGELEPYTLRFDNRVTYLDRHGKRQGDFFRERPPANSSLSALRTRVAHMSVPTIAVSNLFQWPVFADDMRDFYSLWSRDTEDVLRVGALALAYMYRLERIRRGGAM